MHFAHGFRRHQSLLTRTAWRLERITSSWACGMACSHLGRSGSRSLKVDQEESALSKPTCTDLPQLMPQPPRFGLLQQLSPPHSRAPGDNHVQTITTRVNQRKPPDSRFAPFLSFHNKKKKREENGLQVRTKAEGQAHSPQVPLIFQDARPGEPCRLLGVCRGARHSRW